MPATCWEEGLTHSLTHSFSSMFNMRNRARHFISLFHLLTCLEKIAAVSLPRPRKDAMIINAMSHLVYQTVRYIMSPECLSSISSVDEKLKLSKTFYTVQSVKPAFDGALCKAKRFLDLDQVALLLLLETPDDQEIHGNCGTD